MNKLWFDFFHINSKMKLTLTGYLYSYLGMRKRPRIVVKADQKEQALIVYPNLKFFIHMFLKMKFLIMKYSSRMNSWHILREQVIR